MSKVWKVLLIVAGLLGLIFLSVAIFLDDYVEGKVALILEQERPNVDIEYDSIDFNTFSGNLRLFNPRLTVRDSISDFEISRINLKEIVLNDISYWDYLKLNKFSAHEILILNPSVEYWKFPDRIDTLSPPKTATPFIELNIKNFRVRGMDLRIYESDSVLATLENMNMDFYNFYLPSIVSSYSDVKQDSINIISGNIYYKLSDFEIIKVSNLNYNSNKLILGETSLKTKYSRAEFDRSLKQERDWYDIKVDSIYLQNPDFIFISDTLQGVEISVSTFFHPQIDIYRNKLLPDERSNKKYYGSMLRDLPINLTLDSIYLKDGTVNYDEKVISSHPAGKLTFSDFNAEISNFSNTYVAPEITTINVQTNFMGTAPLNVFWQFDSTKEEDNYLFEGDLGYLQTANLNQFTVNNLNISLEGEINRTYFTISGDKHISHIDIKTKYEDFKITFLKDKNGEKRRKTLISAVVNIFVKKNSDEATDNFSTGSANVERDKTKSFYANLWKNLSMALKEALTGDDEEN